MVRFTRSDDLQRAEFVDADLRGARFVGADLSGVVMRGVDVAEADIDPPWLPHGRSFRLNGVDVVPFVEAELDRRFPGRALRRATDPDGLREAWAALEDTWGSTLERVASMPPGHRRGVGRRRVVVRSDAAPLRPGHRPVVGPRSPGHPAAVPPAGPRGQRYRGSGPGPSGPDPGHTVVRGGARGAGGPCRDGAGLPRHRHRPRPARSAQQPARSRRAGDTLSCLHVVLEEEWEHHRYAVRDLASLQAGTGR